MLYDCPMNDYTCPYFDMDEGMCAMEKVGDGDPHKECDAWFGIEDEEEEEE